MKILLAEHDPHLATFMADALTSQNFGVELAHDREQAQRLAVAGSFDLMVLDLGARQGVGSAGDGLLAAVRATNPSVPVLVLSEGSRVEERVQILDAGADDLMAKPFAVAEMTARIRALLRRGGTSQPSMFVVGDLKLHRMERWVERDGRQISLSSKEFALLEYLMLHAGRVVSRAQIIVDVWHLAGGITTNVVDVYINYLRQKVEGPGLPRLIHTVRGTGYRLSPPPPM